MALTSLQSSPTVSNVTLSAAPAADVHAVHLEQLPVTWNCPASLAERCWYDSQRQRLVFRGFMSKAAFDRLHALSNDSAYQRALDELFRQCVYEEPQARQRGRMLPLGAAVTLALLAIALALPLRYLALR